ncbi:MAG: TetR/AcrR family transcriptional regulator [Angelakisella sp.]|nr:TetR/AcrR family transcriptional regulator [Angelakisella sp.]
MQVLEKKQHKRLSLLESSYELFSNKGVHDTSIDDIVKKAKVAKGTFYLYFKDKYDILDRLVMRKSAAVIEAGIAEMARADAQNPMSFEDRFLFFVDYAINYLQNDRKLLTILRKNLSWGIIEATIHNTEAKEAIDELYCELERRGHDHENAKQILYLVLEMAGSACYSTIIDGQPCTIEELKPTLYQMIRKMLQ